MVSNKIKISCRMLRVYLIWVLTNTFTKDTKLSGLLTVRDDLLDRFLRPTILYDSSSDTERQRYRLNYRHMI